MRSPRFPYSESVAVFVWDIPIEALTLLFREARRNGEEAVPEIGRKLPVYGAFEEGSCPVGGRAGGLSGQDGASFRNLAGDGECRIETVKCRKCGNEIDCDSVKGDWWSLDRAKFSVRRVPPGVI
jgi:hypothetical protein